jgi:hypothetical protein
MGIIGWDKNNSLLFDSIPCLPPWSISFHLDMFRSLAEIGSCRLWCDMEGLRELIHSHSVLLEEVNQFAPSWRQWITSGSANNTAIHVNRSPPLPMLLKIQGWQRALLSQ